ncbi:uncharacterized protein LOC127088093 [Lathyrus oleraceus]|uniref:uncharacterized protein LOC127088093 n=1 Tax=Pisum sativum TaxID=3888 RepID=UPI0021CEC810|nr:uncharacterized protein LOC127088093 [Pisum sativum]
MSGVFESGSGTLTPHVAINHDYSNPENNNYTARSPMFNKGYTKFEWWKSKMYTHIIGLGDELWDILEDGIDILVNEVGMVSDRKGLTPSHKKVYRKHHRVIGILVDAPPHSEYIKIIDKSTAKTIVSSLCATYEGNQQVQEAKVNLLVQHYDMFIMQGDKYIETMFSRFQVLVSELQVLIKSYTTSDHVKNILRSLPVRYRPKLISIQKDKDLNTLSLESLIRNLQSHEMELNKDEPVRRTNCLVFKSVARTARAHKVWDFEETSCA